MFKAYTDQRSTLYIYDQQVYIDAMMLAFITHWKAHIICFFYIHILPL